MAAGLAGIFLVGAAAGYLVAPDGANPASLAAYREQARDAREQAIAARDRAEAAEASLATEQRLGDSADEQVANANARAKELQQEVWDLEKEIARLEDRLQGQASKPKPAPAQPKVALGTIPGEGVWQAGPGGDFPPGTYRNTGGGTCYWARLKNPAGGGLNNIIDNGLGRNQTVQILAHDWFETSNCGEWKQLG